MINDDGEEVPLNNTLGGLLNKLEDGRAINELGAEAQAYIVELRRAAKKRNGRVLGRITIELTIPMGPDGYILPAVKLTTKAIPKPARPESIIFTDEDGDINGLPVPKQTTIFEVKAKGTKDPAAQVAKGM